MNIQEISQTQENSVNSTYLGNFSQNQIEILKNSICKGATNEEFHLFIMACTKTQLDPFMRQIYAVKRWDSRLKRETMTIQTGIDGYRLIAERTERYAPGQKPSFEYDQNGNLISATAYVKKLTKDGTWHIVEAEAFLDEYCQKDKDGKCTGMWKNMQRNQLAKCAESLALRKAFPAEMSGIYTKEEMSQSESVDVQVVQSKNVISTQEQKITSQQAYDLEMILSECDDRYRGWVMECIKKTYKCEFLSDLPVSIYDRVKSAAVKNMEANHEKQREAQSKSNNE